MKILSYCVWKRSAYRAALGRITCSRNHSSSSVENANVAIIGGGCIGTSLAYHLAKFGVNDVCLLEKTELTAGSTWHAAGLTTYYHPGINMRKLHFDSIKMFNKIEAETGQEIGFHATGSLRLAHTKEHMNEFKYMMGRHTHHPANQQLVDLDTIHFMHPLLNMEGILGGLYNPGDGHTDPYSLTMALAAGARMYGAKILQDTPVTATRQRDDGSWEVDTPRGTITAKHLVNAAGFHARQVGQLSGLDLPLVPVHHQYMVTASIPMLEEWKKEGREIPAIRDLRGSYYVRQERTGAAVDFGSLLVGPYEAVDKMVIQDDWYDDGPPKGFGKELFQHDLDRLDKCIEHVVDLLPIFNETDIQSVVAGPITYSPDILPLIGPTFKLKNYWLAVGFGYGIAHSGGAGKFLARWMMNGEPDYDLIECDPDRYGDWCDKQYLLDKARESYGMNTTPVFPGEERWAGRPTKRVSGVYQQTKAKDAGREVDLILNKVGVTDLTPFGKFMLEGPGATKFLSSMVANTMPKVNRVNLSHLLTPCGKVYAELTVTRLDKDRYYIVTGSGSELHDFRWLVHNLPKDRDFTLTNVTENMGVFGVTGKYARDVMSKLTPEDMSHDAFKFLECREMDLAGVPVQATRISYTGELGWELHHDIKDSAKLYDAICTAGRAFDIADYGTLAVNSLRIEKGFRGWGAEMNLDKNPFEAGLNPFIKPNKKVRFIGQDAVKKLKDEELKSKLVTLIVETHGRQDPAGDEVIWFDNKVVGNTTSGAFSYQLGKSICFAYLPPHLASLGNQVYVELLGLRYPAIVSRDPLFDTEPARVAKGAAS